MPGKSLKNKKILITVGPTWVALDRVRVITNIFGGSLGLQIVSSLLDEGAKVTLLVGPIRKQISKNPRLKVLKFRYYSDLYKLFISQLKNNNFDVVVQSAAISDYEPIQIKEKKIKSGKSSLVVRFKPTRKLVDQVKKISPNSILVKFKLEVDKSREELIRIATASMKSSNADIMVANDFKTVIANHKAYVFSKGMKIKVYSGKKNIADAIVNEIKIALK